MKTHLPHGLRVALMAALAFVSLTPYAAVADLIGWKDPSGGTSFNASLGSGDLQYVYIPDGNAPINLTITPKSATVNVLRANATSLYATKTSYKGDIHVTAKNSPFGTSRDYLFVGVGGNAKLTGNLYIRSINGSYPTFGGTMTAIDSGSTVTKNAYLGLDDNSTHSGAVYLANGGTVQGTSTLEIASGTFNGTVAVGNSNAKFDSGTNLTISGGTFGAAIVAGNAGTGTSTITGGTHTTISNGTFNTNATVYGGSANAGTTINGGVTVNITGGTFSASRNVYALGTAGTVNGDVNLTIGNDAKFSGNNIISAGANGNNVNYSGVTSSTVTLKDLTGTSSLATGSSIKVMGGQRGSTLVMNNVDTTIKAQLSDFTSMNVTNGSDLTLTQATNATLGGASTVTIDSGSTLTFENAAGQTWDLSGKNLKGQGTLNKQGTGKLAISRDSSTFNGNVNIGAGTLEVQNTMNANTLSGSGKLAKTGTGTMSVEDASGFTGNIEVSGGTLQLEQVDLSTAKTQTVSVSGGGTVNLMNIADGADVAVKELAIDGGTFGVYSGADVAEPNVVGLTLAAGGKIVIGESTDKNVNVLEANLTTESGSTLDFISGGVLTMGCDLIVGDGTTIVISDAAYASLMDGKDITLFEGVDNEFCLDVTGYVICPTAAASAGGADSTKVYLQTGEGGVAMLSTTANTPEPTTGTLSLLALAGLCARRRRKH